MIVPIFSDINMSWAWWGSFLKDTETFGLSNWRYGELKISVPSPIIPLSFSRRSQLFICTRINFFSLSISARLAWNAEAFETASTILARIIGYSKFYLASAPWSITTCKGLNDDESRGPIHVPLRSSGAGFRALKFE